MSGVKVRALHAVPGVWLERTQTWIHHQVTALPDWIESHVVCDRTENLDEFPFPRIWCRAEAGRAANVWFRAVSAARAQRRLGYPTVVTRRLRPDLVHSHFGPTGWEMLPAVRRCGARHVVTFYGLDVNYLPLHGWSGRNRELFAAVDLVLCEGPHMAECVERLGCDPAKVAVHRLGVDLEAIPFRPRRWCADEPLRVLLAASFREKKGLPYAIEALGRLARDLPVEVTVVGGPSNSPESRAETARIDVALGRSRLGSRVRMLGFQPHAVLAAEAAEHHVFLSPSVTAQNGDTEGGAPVTLIEMAASGIPIVSSRHCDIPDVIEDGVTGLLADERDVAGLVSCLRRLVERPEAWAAMLEAGRRRIEERHDGRTQAAALARRYGALAGRAAA